MALFEQRERFSRLIARGVSNSEACGLVGINRRTGTRWRFDRTIQDAAGRAVQYPPVTNSKRPSKPLSSRYLSLDERTAIADLLRAGGTMRAIAAELGRSPSTISREVRRNRDERGRYLPHSAQRVARARLPRPRQRRLASDAELRDAVAQWPAWARSSTAAGRERIDVISLRRPRRVLCEARGRRQRRRLRRAALAGRVSDVVGHLPPVATGCARWAP